MKDFVLASLTADPIHIGRVRYIDYHADNTWFGNLFDPFVHKTNALQHEEEVRAVVWDHLDDYRDFMNSLITKCGRKSQDPPMGISVICDIEKLVDRVVVSPTAPEWVVDLVTDFCREAIGKPVSQSSLKSEPFF